MTSLFFSQNDSPMRESFWQKNRLATHILFDLCLFEHFSPVANFEQQSLSTQALNNFFSASDIMEAVRGRFHLYGISYKGCVILCMIQVVLLRNKLVEQLFVYFYNTAVENNFLIIKLSFSDFILFYNSVAK